MRAGWLGWQLSAVTAVGTSKTRSACLGFRPRRSRFHVQTYDISVLQSPSSILPIKTHTHKYDPHWPHDDIRKASTTLVCIRWNTDIPSVGTGDDCTCTAPGHTSYMKASLYSTGMLKAMEAWNLQCKKKRTIHEESLLQLQTSTLSCGLQNWSQFCWIHWSFLPDYCDLPSSPGTHRRRDSWHFSPALWWPCPQPAAGSPSGQGAQARCGSAGGAAP